MCVTGGRRGASSHPGASAAPWAVRLARVGLGEVRRALTCVRQRGAPRLSLAQLLLHLELLVVKAAHRAHRAHLHLLDAHVPPLPQLQSHLQPRLPWAITEQPLSVEATDLWHGGVGADTARRGAHESDQPLRAGDHVGLSRVGGTHREECAEWGGRRG